jgi:hypothetical protein
MGMTVFDTATPDASSLDIAFLAFGFRIIDESGE